MTNVDAKQAFSWSALTNFPSLIHLQSKFSKPSRQSCGSLASESGLQSFRQSIKSLDVDLHNSGLVALWTSSNGKIKSNDTLDVKGRGEVFWAFRAIDVEETVGSSSCSDFKDSQKQKNIEHSKQ